MIPLLLPLLLTGPVIDAPDRAPNVVVVFVDDQGYGDVGVYGAEGFSTPNLDQLASEGMRFTDFYAAQPVCSASRAALLTGCYPNRIGISGALGPRSKRGISADETTLAEVCKSRGYATAIFGKWHLGLQSPFNPLRHGFDEYVGIPYSNDMWPWHPGVAHHPDMATKRKEGYPDLPLFEGDTIAISEIKPDDQKTFTRRFTEHAVDFIDRHADEPFFLYVPHPMPHVPLFTSPDFEGVSEQGAYGDVISEIDWSVGRIMAALDRHDIADDTILIYASDNGPWLSYGNHAGSTGPLREGKGSTWEGGVRVPCIVRWPDNVPAGSVCREPTMTIDVLPTIAEIIDADLPARRIDGRSIVPLLMAEENAVSPHEALYFYYHDNHLEAVRAGRWKLVLPHKYRSLTGEPGQDGSPNGYSQKPCGLELYDLENDISETTDLAWSHPEVLEMMLRFAEQARQDLGDKLTLREGRGRREPGRVTE